MRCPRHDLALASDGKCIRCRREEEEAEEGAARASGGRGGAKGGLVAAGLVAAIGVATLVIWALRPADSSPLPRATGAPSAPIATPSAPPLAALDPATVPPDPPPSPAGSSAPTPLEEAMHAAQITFYSRANSPECGLARSWLLARAYAFKERNVDADAFAHDGWMRASGGGVVPAFDVDGQGFAGFDPGRLQAALEYAGARRLQRR